MGDLGGVKPATSPKSTKTIFGGWKTRFGAKKNLIGSEQKQPRQERLAKNHQKKHLNAQKKNGSVLISIKEKLISLCPTLCATSGFSVNHAKNAATKIQRLITTTT